MNKGVKIVIVVALVAAVGMVLAIKAGKSSNSTDGAAAQKTHSATTSAAKPLPRLVDLGADKCVPCKMMAPVLEELRSEYASRLDVEFIDVWKNRSAKKQYGFNLIPTQIFFAADGKELWRHEGYLSKEDILAKWKELGVRFADDPDAASQPTSATPK